MIEKFFPVAHLDQFFVFRLGRCYGMTIDMYNIGSTAVAGGSAEAKADLASYLEAGYGCSPDPKKAFELFKEAALAGVPAAQIRYGEHLLAGDYCPHDPVKGREFIQKGKSSVRKTD